MPVSQFQVVYKKHILTLEDLLTLADQNWLNDQVMTNVTKTFSHNKAADSLVVSAFVAWL